MAFLTSLLDSLDLRSCRWDIKFPGEGRIRDFDARAENFKLSFREHGESNSFEMELDNSDQFFARNDIFEGGDAIDFWLYYAARPKIKMGSFTVDAINDKTKPSSVVKISGLAVDCQKTSLKTPKARAFEEVSLRQIVGSVAAENSLVTVYEGADIMFRRKDQKEEHDLKFLARLAGEYGFRARIENGKLYFLSQSAIEKTVDALPLKEYWGSREFDYKPYRGVKKATVRYFDPTRNELITSSVEAGDIKATRETKETIKVDSFEEAEMIATAKLNRANCGRITGSFDCMGSPEMKPPLTGIVEDEGPKYDGRWHIETADHVYTKSGGYRVAMKGYKL